MAWTAPMTAVANDIFTSAQFNTHVRDNLLETAPAKAATPGGYFVTTGVNSITERTAASTVVATSETTTSTAYTSLATAGPAVTVATGTSALVALSAATEHSALNGTNFTAFAVSGATVLAEGDDRALMMTGIQGGGRTNQSLVLLQTGLTSGANTFTMRYKIASAGTGTWLNRRIAVLPL